MSNLGAYQKITTVSKKVGGPNNLLILTAVAGAFVYKILEGSAKKCIKWIRNASSCKYQLIEVKQQLYTVISSGKSNEGVEFEKGDQFKVLESDGDSVLIEKMNDYNNPYFVSADLLRVISDYKE